MLNVVNHELFGFHTEAGKKNNSDYFKTKVVPNIQINDGKEHRIATIVSGTKNYNDNPMQLSSNKSEGGNVNVLLKSFENNKFDMQLYLVAFPFNGLADAIPQSNMYRIHRGFLHTSKTRSIKFGDSTYKKVLYLLVEPNVRLFEQENPRHVDSIDLQFVSYNIENVAGSDTRQTYKETITLTMYPKTSKKGYDINWKREEVEPIDKEALKDITLYTIYERKDQTPATPEYAAKVTNRFNTKVESDNTRNQRSKNYKKQSGDEIERLGYRTSKKQGQKSGNKKH